MESAWDLCLAGRTQGRGGSPGRERPVARGQAGQAPALGPSAPGHGAPLAPRQGGTQVMGTELDFILSAK